MKKDNETQTSPVSSDCEDGDPYVEIRTPAVTATMALELRSVDVDKDTKQEPILSEDKSEPSIDHGLNGHAKAHPNLKRESTMLGSVVSFHDISYEVKDGIAQKVILNDINGVFKPGMNAILGPTGSGKTSLLDVLAARKNPIGLSGHVLIDGTTQPKNFKCVSGYVTQEDVVMGTLTIRENLEFSAALRLSQSVSKAERDERVRDILGELGLTHVADSKVGTEFIRGVSGGERKRTNVGMELITKPSVLFLDEPTTGLDASTANAVMHLLATLSKKGRTIIFSIHQPRYSIFRLFDQMHLLGKGRTIYHGPAQEALGYFSSIGHECEEHNNPPDFFLDVIIGQSKMDDGDILNHHYHEVDVETGVVEVGVAAKQMEAEGRISLPELYEKSHFNRDMREEAGQIYTEYRSAKQTHVDPIDYPTSFPTQLYHVSKRTLLNILRNPLLMILQNLTVVIFSLIIGGIYFQLDTSISSGYQNRIGAFINIIMNIMMGTLTAVELFIMERVVFLHESASGFYRVSVYFISKVFCDLMPLRVLPAILYALVTYWMIGLQMTVEQFFLYFLTLVLISFASSGIAFAISCTVRIAAVASMLLSLVFIIMMVFGGLLVNIASLPAWLSWIQYLSIVRYAVNALLINEIEDLEFCEDVPIANTSRPFCIPGTVYLDQQGIDYSDWGFWQNEMALAIITVGFLIIGYIQLRRIPKLK